MERTRLLRVFHIVGDKRKGIEPLIPIGRATLYQWIKAGKFPKPYVRKTRFVAWREKDVLKWIEENRARE